MPAPPVIDYVGSSARARVRPHPRVEIGSLLQRLDWALLGATAGVVAYGLWAIAGITRADIPGDPSYYVWRQGVFAALGAVGLFLAILIDPKIYLRYRRAIYLGTLGTMAFILVAGAAARHSKRWIDLGFFRFQPSEFGKVLFVLFLAGFLAERGRRIGEAKVVAAAVALGVGPIVFVFLEPDIGTALVYGAALAAVLFVAGARWWHLAVLALAVVVTSMAVLWWLPAGGVQVLKPYQTKRLTGFTHPDTDPRGSTYNVKQSITSVGSGGVRGRGVHGATQTRLDYLPEHNTDFAFASLAEQRGFLGASLLLLLYLLIVWRGLKVVTVARDVFSAIAAGGIVVALLFQIFVNVGMTMGIAPITGIPLPFVSVGGSSLIANLLAIGILLSIHARGTAGPRRGRIPRP
jgi:rod shape determining protein RodA